MFYVLLYVTLCPFKYCNHLDGEERELIALLNLSSWCLVMVERLFLAVPLGCLQFVIVVFPDHTHLLFFMCLLVLLRFTHVLTTEISSRISNLLENNLKL